MADDTSTTTPPQDDESRVEEFFEGVRRLFGETFKTVWPIGLLPFFATRKGRRIGRLAGGAVREWAGHQVGRVVNESAFAYFGLIMIEIAKWVFGLLYCGIYVPVQAYNAVHALSPMTVDGIINVWINHVLWPVGLTFVLIELVENGYILAMLPNAGILGGALGFVRGWFHQDDGATKRSVARAFGSAEVGMGHTVFTFITKAFNESGWWVLTFVGLLSVPVFMMYPHPAFMIAVVAAIVWLWRTSFTGNNRTAEGYGVIEDREYDALKHNPITGELTKVVGHKYELAGVQKALRWPIAIVFIGWAVVSSFVNFGLTVRRINAETAITSSSIYHEDGRGPAAARVGNQAWVMTTALETQGRWRARSDPGAWLYIWIVGGLIAVLGLVMVVMAGSIHNLTTALAALLVTGLLFIPLTMFFNFAIGATWGGLGIIGIVVMSVMFFFGLIITMFRRASMSPQH